MSKTKFSPRTLPSDQVVVVSEDRVVATREGADPCDAHEFPANCRVTNVRYVRRCLDACSEMSDPATAIEAARKALEAAQRRYEQLPASRSVSERDNRADELAKIVNALALLGKAVK